MNHKLHWEHIYQTKQPSEVSWTQTTPYTSLELIKELEIGKDEPIIDIGGGDSHLVDSLLDLGYSNITVLDISEAALKRAQLRLGAKANSVTWIVTDILNFEPLQKYKIWHDRAVFHFLITETEIANYKKIAFNGVEKHMIIGTFSENGPKKCSSLDIKQYSTDELALKWSPEFSQIRSLNIDHITPFETIQNFSFCSFEKR
jgi:hypothetical protein